MRTFVDDNYGEWHNADDPSVQRFYQDVQERSRVKRCSICGRKVRLLPHYDKCDSCCNRLERGDDLYY